MRPLLQVHLSKRSNATNRSKKVIIAAIILAVALGFNVGSKAILSNNADSNEMNNNDITYSEDIDSNEEPSVTEDQTESGRTGRYW